MNYVFLKWLSYTLFTRMLLLFRISFNILQILLDVTVPATLTKNQAKAIYQLIKKKFSSFKVTYKKDLQEKSCPQEKLSHKRLAYKKNLARKKSCLLGRFRYFKCLLKKCSRPQHMSLFGHSGLKTVWLLFVSSLVSSPPSTTTFRFQNS